MTEGNIPNNFNGKWRLVLKPLTVGKVFFGAKIEVVVLGRSRDYSGRNCLRWHGACAVGVRTTCGEPTVLAITGSNQLDGGEEIT